MKISMHTAEMIVVFIVVTDVILGVYLAVTR